MRAKSAKEWAGLVADWESRGVAARVIAQEAGVREQTLRWWKTEFQRRKAKGTAPILLAKVVREGEVAASEVVVLVGSARIVVQAGFDPSHLRAVVEALSERA
jgi:hypothetical protein